MALIEGMLQEFREEAHTTRRVLERVPEKHFNWRPHRTARSVGELAMHIANLPGSIAEIVSQPRFVAGPIPEITPKSAAEVTGALEASVSKATRILEKMDDATFNGTWRMMFGEREVLALPRAVALRSIMLNHWYHHRGQLSVYYRELEVPVPSIYGASRDENPFA